MKSRILLACLLIAALPALLPAGTETLSRCIRSAEI